MIFVYASRTGKVKKFVQEVGIEAKAIGDIDVANEPFVLITYTDLYGQVPKVVEDFLNENHHNLVGVAASGSYAWGKDLFARSGDIISEKYNVPLLLKFQMSGLDGDFIKFKERVDELYGKMD